MMKFIKHTILTVTLPLALLIPTFSWGIFPFNGALGSPITPYDSYNTFAQILRKELPSKKVAENAYAYAFWTKKPQEPIHILAIPKGRYKDFLAFNIYASAEEKLGFFSLLQDVLEDARLKPYLKNGYRITSNNGHNGRQTVGHFHMHITGGKKLPWPVYSRERLSNNLFSAWQVGGPTEGTFRGYPKEAKMAPTIHVSTHGTVDANPLTTRKSPRLVVSQKRKYSFAKTHQKKARKTKNQGNGI